MIPWTPWSKKRPRISKLVPGKHPRTHQPADDKAAEKRTREFLEQNWKHPIQSGNLRLSAMFYRPTRQIVDTDNLVKHLMDSATGVLWVNDAQVTAFGETELHLDRDNPRTEFWLESHETDMIRYFPAPE